MRGFALLCFLLPLPALGQVPDVRVRVDGLASLSTDANGKQSARFYDVLGRRGLLGITFYLEPGFRAFASQRFQQISGDPDQEPLDEYYVEDEGLWRLGKQILPFGSGRILRETVLAARGDTNLIFEGLPISVAFCDAGPGRQRGVVGRLGSRIGASVAWGQHFGIAATSFTDLRAPEASPGEGRGYRQAFGVDAAKTFGAVRLAGEAVILREGMTALDEEDTILDGSASWQPHRFSRVSVGWTRSFRMDRNVFRLHGSYVLDRNLTIEPLVRWNGGAFQDASLIVRFRF